MGHGRRVIKLGKYTHRLALLGGALAQSGLRPAEEKKDCERNLSVARAERGGGCNRRPGPVKREEAWKLRSGTVDSRRTVGVLKKKGGCGR